MTGTGHRWTARARWMLGLLILAAASLALMALILKMANPLPSRTGFPADQSVPDVPSRLAQSAAQFTAGREGKTALHLLTRGIDAIAMRLAMVRNAQRSIDAQYYIWEGDLSGRMLLAEIVAAADRGVRVRLLIDDNPTAGLDPMWAGVEAHPNIAVRIFNPMTIRSIRPANYLFDFPRLNRRMHNKSLTVDGAATLVGGRNVGDAYFGVKDRGLFIDVDALAIGAVVPDVAAEFERYWSSNAAFPASTLLASDSAISLADLRHPEYEDAGLAESYRTAVDNAIETLWLSDDPEAAFIWAPVRLLADDPAKAAGHASEDSLLVTRIADILANARSRIDLVSGYFVPGNRGADLLEGLARQGVRTRIVTNSLQVTDVPVVHAGYAPYRKDLLRSGALLFEAKPQAEHQGEMRILGQTRFSGGGESVHAKTFAIDGRTFFVGSFNLDPRSAQLNCEMGFLVNSSELAAGLAAVLDKSLTETAYALALDGEGKMTWTALTDGKKQVYRTEPGTTLWSRAAISTLARLPIEWML